MKKKHIILIVITILFGIALIGIFSVFFHKPDIEDSNELNVLDVITRIDSIKEYQMTIFSNAKHNIEINATCNLDEKENSILADINIDGEEPIDSTIKYIYPHDSKTITQEIYANDKIIATNQMPQDSTVDLRQLDPTGLLKFFATSLETDNVCNSETCYYVLSSQELFSFSMHLDILTFGLLFESLNNLESLPVTVTFEDVKIKNVVVVLSNTEQIQIAFLYE